MAVRPGDPKFEETVLRWYEELESQYDSDNEGTDYEDSVSVQSDSDSIVSIEEEEYEDREGIIDKNRENKAEGIDSEKDPLQPKKFRGKNGYSWSAEPPSRTRTPQRNIVFRLPGPKNDARNITTILDSWKLFFSDEIIISIVVYTNQEIGRQRQKYSKDCRYVNDTDSIEIMALFGLLYIAGQKKDNHQNSKEMWSKFGPEIYRCIMSETRFRFLISCIRFDDKRIRDPQDKFAPIRTIWERFISNCTKNYTPHSYCTIDEQLLGFRGNCPFRVYIASKPDKYGLKIMTMCDSRTFYMVSAIPYIGKIKRPDKEPVPDYYVRTLTESIHGTGRNITMDNWFTSIPLTDKMLTEFNLTIVGTIRKNKPEIPLSFLPSREKKEGTSQFAFSNKKTLVSYTPKKMKSVLLLSSMHSGKVIDENSKPEIINFYNSTKGGVDTFDQMMHTSSVSRKTRRWPLRFFYGMLDQAGINCDVIHQIVKGNRKKSTRRTFLFDLGFALAKPHMERRLTKNLPGDLASSIRNILDVKDEPRPEGEPPRKLLKQKRCFLCARTNDRKTKTACGKCSKPICNDHRVEICLECLK